MSLVLDLKAGNGSLVESHVEFLLDHRGGLILLLVVDIEANGDVGIQTEPLLQHLPDPQDGLVMGSIRKPDCDLVSPLTDIDNSSVDLST